MQMQKTDCQVADRGKHTRLRPRPDLGTVFMSEEPAPSPWTVRRWIHKFGTILENAKQSVEIFLIRNIPDYHPATVPMSSHPFKTLLEKASHLESNRSHLSFFSPLSYIFYVNAL